jgi:hypothetical protein
LQLFGRKSPLLQAFWCDDQAVRLTEILPERRLGIDILELSESVIEIIRID